MKGSKVRYARFDGESLTDDVRTVVTAVTFLTDSACLLKPSVACYLGHTVLTSLVNIYLCSEHFDKKKKKQKQKVLIISHKKSNLPGLTVDGILA